MRAKPQNPSGNTKLASRKRDPAIDAYLANVTATHRALLQKLRKTIHAIVPGIEECISYRIPAFRFDGVVVAGFAATSKGCSYYPFSGKTLSTISSKLEGYSRTKSALHFGVEQPLYPPLVRRLIVARIAEGKR